MDNIFISDLLESDAQEVRRVGLSTPELQVSNDEPAYYSEERLRGFFKSTTDIHLAARKDGQLVGYFLATYNSFLKEAYIIDVVILPDFRNQGISKMLFQRYQEILRERGAVWTWALVHEDNQRMMHVFQKNGFHKGRNFTFFFKAQPF